jgi:hypothetical protein
VASSTRADDDPEEKELAVRETAAFFAREMRPRQF